LTKPGQIADSEPKKKKRSRRQDRTQEISDALYRAAFQVVGEFGYSGSTIQMITRRAKVANGTFYNYFPSQNDLFEKLLPELGEQLRAYIDGMIEKAPDPASVERAILRGIFEFSSLNPEFYRILTEAETLVPNAHRRYIMDMTDWYTRILSAHLPRDTGRSEEDYNVFALILLAAHHYLTLRYTRWVGGEGVVPEWVMKSYSELLSVHFAGSATRTPVAAPIAAEIDHHSGRTLKFMPSMGTGRPYSNISAATAPLACRMRRRDDGVAVVELDLEPHLLSSVGTGTSAVICSLGEIAALGAVAPDREEVLSLKPISITSNLIRVVQDGTLVAEATMENSGRHIRFVSVRITRKSDPAKLIANVSIVFRLG
jgi:AcrR family transcriptional regulator/acyl-coenzyme A thioesterase PaaI-like protein